MSEEPLEPIHWKETTGPYPAGKAEWRGLELSYAYDLASDRMVGVALQVLTNAEEEVVISNVTTVAGLTAEQVKQQCEAAAQKIDAAEIPQNGMRTTIRYNQSPGETP